MPGLVQFTLKAQHRCIYHNVIVALILLLSPARSIVLWTRNTVQIRMHPSSSKTIESPKGVHTGKEQDLLRVEGTFYKRPKTASSSKSAFSQVPKEIWLLSSNASMMGSKRSDFFFEDPDLNMIYIAVASGLVVVLLFIAWAMYAHNNQFRHSTNDDTDTDSSSTESCQKGTSKLRVPVNQAKENIPADESALQASSRSFTLHKEFNLGGNSFQWMPKEDVMKQSRKTGGWFRQDMIPQNQGGAQSVQNVGQLHAAGGSAVLIPPPWSVENVKKILSEHNVNISRWSQESLQNLYRGMQTSKSFLVRDESGVLKRFIQFVVVIVKRADGQVLVPVKHRFKPSASQLRKEMKSKGDVMLASRRHPAESIHEAVCRCVREKLGLSEGILSLSAGRVKTTETEESADFFPGLATITRRHWVQATVATTDPEQLQSIGIGTKEGSFERDEKDEITTFAWRPLQEVAMLRTHMAWLSGRSSFPEHQKRESLFSLADTGLQVVTPWTSTVVKELLQKSSTSVEVFGMSVEELSDAASTNELELGIRRKDKKLVAVLDVVCLMVWNSASDAVMVRAGQSEHVWHELVRRHDEGAWDTGRRILRSQLHLQDEGVSLEACSHKLTEEEEGHFVKRKLLICARLGEDVEKQLQNKGRGKASPSWMSPS